MTINNQPQNWFYICFPVEFHKKNKTEITALDIEFKVNSEFTKLLNYKFI